MAEPAFDPLALGQMLGRRYRLLKPYDNHPAGTTGVCSQICWKGGNAAPQIEWDIPGYGRIPHVSLFSRKEFDDYLIEC